MWKDLYVFTPRLITELYDRTFKKNVCKEMHCNKFSEHYSFKHITEI